MEPAPSDPADAVSRLRLPIFIGILVIFLLLIGVRLFSHFRQAQSGQAIEFISATESAVISAEIKVDISGGVQRPGVYTLPKDSRVQDLIEKAGGLDDEADRDWVAKQVNLAQKLVDGGKLYIPLEGEQGVVGGNSVQLGVTAGSSVISVNNGTAAELESLPGVGEVTAGKIIKGRPYQNLDELVSKKVIYKSLYDKIKEQISL